MVNTQIHINKNSLQRIVLTGGPNSGKSTSINLLSKKGYQIVPETARVLIGQEVSKDSDCLPWKNVSKFQNTLSNLQYNIEEKLNEGFVFLDRSLVDGYAYSILDNIPVPDIILKNAENRYAQVFLLEILPNYNRDEARWEDEDKAKYIGELMISTYKKFGYNPIIVPVLPPEERINFMLNHLDVGGK
jgi:predicted ATPase